jgi:hypothetical protein
LSWWQRERGAGRELDELGVLLSEVARNCQRRAADALTESVDRASAARKRLEDTDGMISPFIAGARTIITGLSEATIALERRDERMQSLMEEVQSSLARSIVQLRNRRRSLGDTYLSWAQRSQTLAVELTSGVDRLSSAVTLSQSAADAMQRSGAQLQRIVERAHGLVGAGKIHLRGWSDLEGEAAAALRQASRADGAHAVTLARADQILQSARPDVIAVTAQAPSVPANLVLPPRHRSYAETRRSARDDARALLRGRPIMPRLLALDPNYVAAVFSDAAALVARPQHIANYIFRLTQYCGSTQVQGTHVDDPPGTTDSVVGSIAVDALLRHLFPEAAEIPAIIRAHGGEAGRAAGAGMSTPLQRTGLASLARFATNTTNVGLPAWVRDDPRITATMLGLAAHRATAEQARVIRTAVERADRNAHFVAVQPVDAERSHPAAAYRMGRTLHVPDTHQSGASFR